ncbi:hypothetical protein AAG570_008893 [Ranatra chinensis]|uniref:Uncharacterized protein n=1 Tax=Ranatra chinensis TaxID=642074 RepID=A0ABD0YSV4_9HEMI
MDVFKEIHPSIVQKRIDEVNKMQEDALAANAAKNTTEQTDGYSAAIPPPSSYSLPASGKSTLVKRVVEYFSNEKYFDDQRVEVIPVVYDDEINWNEKYEI